MNVAIFLIGHNDWAVINGIISSYIGELSLNAMKGAAI